ncbi:MAG: adenylate cyclase [Chlamydiales bacterium]|jgi:adenylate cyclase
MSQTTDEQHERVPRWLAGLGLALGALAVALLLQFGAGTGPGQALDQLELKSLDARFRLRERFAPTAHDEEIVILDIDDLGIAYYENLDLLGPNADGSMPVNMPWPWPREVYGQAVTFLRAAGAQAVFFDFLFTGESPYQNLTGGDDDFFAEDSAAAGNVFHTLLFREPAGGAASAAAPAEFDLQIPSEANLDGLVLEGRLASFPAARLQAASLPIDASGVREYTAVEVPLAIHGEAAKGLGSINATVDGDGIIRRVPLLSRFRGATYRSIHLALAADGADSPVARWSGEGPSVVLGEVEIPVDEQGQMLINWHGPAKTYAPLALHRLLLKLGRGLPPDDIDRARYAGKIVMIGTSATGLADLKATPFGANYPGVEIHATALDNILNGDFLRRPRALWRNLLTGFFFLLAGQLLLRKQGAGKTLAIALALVSVYVAGAIWVFISAAMWVDLVLPAGGLVLLFAGAQTVHFLTEGRQKREMRSAFQRYLPPAVVSEVLRLPPDQLKLGGDRRELTVYFSDIQDFTSMSEGLAPEELVRLLNIYLGEMSDIVSARGGTLDKYIGDCIMAFWGAPLALEHAPLDACLAALENQERMVDLRRRFREKNLPEIHARIGINTGPMLVGNLGSDRHFDFTVMGDAVNLASRLEGANKAYGTRIMLGPETAVQAASGIETRELDLMRVKGRSQPVQVFELLAAHGGLTEVQKELREGFRDALAAYRARDWKVAMAGFDSCLTLDGSDGPSQTYRDRCVHFRDHPPSEDWDGVFAMRTK